ncbi:MAG: carboxypeptidase-like regulatory domain-containing protein, partial [Candidatus Latescibacterota bacterium]
MVKWMVLFACLIPTLIEAQDGAIVGTISDVQMGIPISNVNVRVEKQVRAISDSSGYYHIRTLSAGQYDIEFSHVGYETLQKSVTVISGQTDTVNIGLKKLTLMAKEAVVMAERDVGDWIVDKETPASYATLDAKTLEETHTTHDLPELIQDVPGVWGSSAGLGEA